MSPNYNSFTSPNTGWRHYNAPKLPRATKAERGIDPPIEMPGARDKRHKHDKRPRRQARATRRARARRLWHLFDSYYWQIITALMAIGAFALIIK